MWFIKVQCTPEQAMKAQRGSSYRHTLSSTSVLDGGGWLMQRPGHFTSGKKIRCPAHGTGWAPGEVWMAAENFAPAGI
jgi:hypothetical protein